MSLCGAVWHCGGCLIRWLFVEECTTAAPLLSLSFAVNSIFTGLSMSRFNLSTQMKNKVVKCIEGIADDQFLVKWEQVETDGKTIIERGLKEFNDKVEQFTASLTASVPVWEMVRRRVTICCAALAFGWMCIEPKTRIGLVLVVPYLLLLLVHALWMWTKYTNLKIGYHSLKKAMDKAKKDVQEPFDMVACINKLKKSRETLLALGDEEKGPTP